jgi:hypothetical protein
MPDAIHLPDLRELDGQLEYGFQISMSCSLTSSARLHGGASTVATALKAVIQSALHAPWVAVTPVLFSLPGGYSIVRFTVFIAGVSIETLTAWRTQMEQGFGGICVPLPPPHAASILVYEEGRQLVAILPPLMDGFKPFLHAHSAAALLIVATAALGTGSQVLWSGLADTSRHCITTRAAPGHATHGPLLLPDLSWPMAFRAMPPGTIVALVAGKSAPLKASLGPRSLPLPGYEFPLPVRCEKWQSWSCMASVPPAQLADALLPAVHPAGAAQPAAAAQPVRCVPVRGIRPDCGGCRAGCYVFQKG